MKHLVNFAILFIMMVGCSWQQKASEEQSTEMASSLKSEEDLINEALEDIDEQDLISEQQSEQGILEQQVSEAKKERALTEESFVPEESDRLAMEDSGKSSSSENIKIYEIEEYKVRKDESLMLIAYKIYGDYLKWKELASLNSDVVKGKHMIKAETTLKYYRPEQKFEWQKQGSPYLVKKGDYLGKISQNVYGKASRWVDIWKYNSAMIKDPDLIFVGFTLYYLEDGKYGQRDMASK